MYKWLPIGLNLLLALVYCIAIIPSFVLSARTKDRKVRIIRLLTALISAGFFILTLVLALQRAVTLGLISDAAVLGFERLHIVDAVLLLNLIAVSLQIYGARGKIGALTNVFNEIHQMRQEATLDSLTGLYNRHVYARIVDNADWSDWCLLMMDVDDFKVYNDLYGHLEGDEALKAVASCVLGNIRSTDMAFRYGGEEIIAICPYTSIDDGLLIAERIRSAVEKLSMGITISIGMDLGNGTEGIKASLARADKALFVAKDQGKNRVA